MISLLLISLLLFWLSGLFMGVSVMLLLPHRKKKEKISAGHSRSLFVDTDSWGGKGGINL